MEDMAPGTVPRSCCDHCHRLYSSVDISVTFCFFFFCCFNVGLDGLPADRIRVGVKKLAVGSKIKHVGVDDTSNRDAFTAAMDLEFYETLVRTKMFATFLKEFLNPQFRLESQATDGENDNDDDGDAADGVDNKMPIVLFFIAKLPEKYHQAATEYPVLHLAERVARELQHEQDISIVVVPEANQRFLSLLNYRYDLFTGTGTDNLPSPTRVHVSTLSVPTLLMFDFRQLKAFEFRNFNVDQSLFEKLSNIVRFVGKALSGDWPPFQTLQQRFSDPDYIREQYRLLSPPFKYFDGADQLCGPGSVRATSTRTKSADVRRR